MTPESNAPNEKHKQPTVYLSYNSAIKITKYNQNAKLINNFASVSRGLSYIFSDGTENTYTNINHLFLSIMKVISSMLGVL